MTLPPLDTDQVRGVAGPEYKVGPWCAVPPCPKPAEDAHHLWRRSKLGGPFDWVEIPDGSIVANKTGLCPEHHREVTGRIGGYGAAIKMTSDHVFWWCVPGHPEQGDPEWLFKWPLDPQPPTREALVASPATAESENACPTCGRPRARRRHTQSPPDGGRRRARKNWTIPVPQDAEEDGAWILDTLTDDLAPLLGLHPNKQGHWTTARYYVVVPALYFVQQHREQFIKETVG